MQTFSLQPVVLKIGMCIFNKEGMWKQLPNNESRRKDPKSNHFFNLNINQKL